MNFKHGMYGTPTHNSFKAMHRRCKGESKHHAHYYVEKGISICPEWFDFKNFLADMGMRPDGMTLDRIDSKKGYYPENCRWADTKTQSRNRSCSLMIEIDGVVKHVAEWAEISGISYKTIRDRIFRYGWGHKKAVFQQTHKQHLNIDETGKATE